MLKRILCLVGLGLLLSQFTYAQTGSVSGQITDAETDETVIGATALIPDLEIGATTDQDGEFLLQSVPVGTYTLEVRFIGYQTASEEIEVVEGEVTEVQLSLEPGAIGLDEMVVTGYGVQERRELTGSQSGVRSRDIEDVPLQNAESLLQGRAAGVNVKTTSGNPGGAFQVQVRGTGSINAPSEPLYIVDGVQMSFSQMPGNASSSPLNSINPQDIESIEVLKDAAAASIYGSQAASGVVLITTKRGAEGETRISARSETGIRNLASGVDYLDRDQYLDYYGDANYHNGIDAFGRPVANRDQGREFAEEYFELVFGTPPGAEEGEFANTNWQDIVFRDDAISQKYSVSASGGVQDTDFYISAGYEDTEGHIRDSDFDRLNLRTNFDHQMTDRLRASVSSNIARSRQGGVCQDGNFINCPPSQAMFTSPFAFPWADEDETEPANHPLFGASGNPLVTQREVDRDVTVLQITSSVDLNYNLTDWIDLRGSVGVDYRSTEDAQHRTQVVAPDRGGWTNVTNRRVENYTANLTANISQTFDDIHNVNALLGTEYRRDWSQFVNVTGDGFPGRFFEVLDASSTPTTASGADTEWRVGSYFGSTRYNYDQRYYLTFTARLDGHSRFGADTRWGFFPSISGAWDIAEEGFFPGGDTFDDLRLRASYGLTGNSNIGNFASRGLYSAEGSYAGETAITPDQLANLNLGWEEAEEYNVGLDYSIYRGRISGSIDAYRRQNQELLFERPLPQDSGFEDINENIGTVQNRGIEFEISSVNIQTADFTWSTSFNISFTDNEIIELPDGDPIDANSNFFSLHEGEAIGTIQVPNWAGVNPADGRPMWYDQDGNITYQPTEDDAEFYKDGVANQVGGFGNTLSYRGITLDAFFEFSAGQWGFGATDAWFTRSPDFFMNLYDGVEDRWREPGDVTHVPRAITAGGDYSETADYRTQQGTHMIDNAGYLRLKNVTLSYNMPVQVTETLNLRGLRIFATGVNLATWTQWRWYDPEIAFDTTDIYSNYTQASYPTGRQFNIGVEVDF